MCGNYGMRRLSAMPIDPSGKLRANDGYPGPSRAKRPWYLEINDEKPPQWPDTSR